MNKYISNTIIILTVLISTAFASDSQPKSPKYVFFMIGDGMSSTHVHAAEAYLQQSTVGPDTEGQSGISKLNMTQLPVVGAQKTYATNRLITDSAAAGTAMACGHKTSCGTLGMKSDHKTKLKSIAEAARDNNMKVGILTTVSIDHATPASFYSHQRSRDNYWLISKELSESGFDFFGGGGMKGERVKDGKRRFQPGQPKAIKANDPIEYARINGYEIATNRDELKAIAPGSKVFAYSKNYLEENWAMQYTLDRPKEDLDLAEYTSEAIRILDNPNGFFIMIEGGKIDWASHANDAKTVITEVIDFDKAVKVALDFYADHKDETLVVVTGDHETGGLTMGFAGMHYETAYETLVQQNMSFEAFNRNFLWEYKRNSSWKSKEDNIDDTLKEKLKSAFGLDYSKLTNYQKEQLESAFDRSMGHREGHHDENDILYGGYEPITVAATHMLNRRAGLSWSTFSHTATPILVYSTGVQSDLFGNMYENSDIAHKLAKALNIELE